MNKGNYAIVSTLIICLCFIVGVILSDKLQSSYNDFDSTPSEVNYKSIERQRELSEQRTLDSRYPKDVVYLKLGALLQMDNPDEAYSALLSQKEGMLLSDFEKYQQEILFQLAESDPIKGSELLSSVNSVEGKELVMRGIANGWAKVDIQQGFDFLESKLMENASVEVFNECHSILMDQYAKEDVLTAAAIFKESSDENFQSGLLYVITDKYADLNYPDSLAWALTLESDKLRDLALLQLLDKYSQAQFEPLSKLIQKHKSEISPHVVSAAMACLEQK